MTVPAAPTSPLQTPDTRVVANDDLLLQRIYRWHQQDPTRTWLVQPTGKGRVEEYSWQRGLDEAKRMARYLQSLDLPPGSRIALLTRNSAHFILMEVAIWMAGHVSVALFPTLAPASIRYILEHCEARVLFVGKLDGWDTMRTGVPDTVQCIAGAQSPESARSVFPLWEDLIAQHAPIDDNPVRAMHDVAAIIYTSGSTGQAKGVVHTFHSFSVVPVGTRDLYPLARDDRMLSYLPLTHVLERAMIMATGIYNGLVIYFADSLDTFAADLRRARPTLFQSVPRLWLKFQSGVHEKIPETRLNLLFKLPIIGRLTKKKILQQLGLDSVRYAFTFSAPMPAAQIAWYRAIGLELLEGYGMTENFGYSHLSRPGDVRVGWVGHPEPGVEARLSESGELEMRCPSLMKEYYKQPELSNAAYSTDCWFKTGDLGEMDDTGRLRITGRAKELFKTSKGEYVAPAPIENIINATGTVEQSCVMGADQSQPFAVVMLSNAGRRELATNEGRQKMRTTLTAQWKSVNAQLAAHERLAFLAVANIEWTIGNGLLTPSMKIQRGMIEKRYVARMAGWYAEKEQVVFE